MGRVDFDNARLPLGLAAETWRVGFATLLIFVAERNALARHDLRKKWLIVLQRRDRWILQNDDFLRTGNLRIKLQ